jgi:hypothetical protein
MLTGILAFFQAIPAITGGINNFVSHYFDAKVQITAARIGGDVDVAKSMVSGVVAEGQTRVELLKAVGQSKFLMVLIGGFAAPFMIYVWKVVVFDIVLRLGVTDPIKGNVADWGGVIIASIFGAGTVLGVGQMYFNRKQP